VVAGSRNAPPAADPVAVAKVLAALTLMGGAVSLSKRVDGFAVWLLAGLGAALGLMLANLDAVLSYIPAAEFRATVNLFLCALGLAVLQRYLGVGIHVGAETFEATLGRFCRVGIGNFDLSTFNAEVDKAYPPPWRWVVRWARRRGEAGDTTLMGRLVARLGLAQSILVLAEAVVIGCAVSKLAAALSLD